MFRAKPAFYCTRAKKASPGCRFSGSQLIADRQATDALASGGEDGVAQRRCEGWKPRLADPARRHVDARGDDVHISDRRRFVDAKHAITVVVALLDAALLEGDLAIERETHSHHRSAFDLRANPLGIGGEAAIDRGVDPRHDQMALIVHHRLDDGCDIGEEAAMDGDTETMPRRQLAAPVSLLRHELDDAPETSRVDRVGLERVAVIPEIGDLR